MAMDAFVPLTTDGRRGNDGTGAKPSGRTARPPRSMLRAVVRMAAELAAQPVRWLWKDQLALGKIAVVAGAANVGKSMLRGTTPMTKVDRRSEVRFLLE